MTTATVQWVLIGASLLSGISVLLGFIALLTQKKYIDKASDKVTTEVDVPGFGKMKTNFPALVFVFLGFGLAVYVLHSAQTLDQGSEDVDWLITGQFKSTDTNRVWLTQNLGLQQSPIIPYISAESGQFQLTVPIPRGLKFEDKYNYITYSDGKWSASISTAAALSSFNQGATTNLSEMKDGLRHYAPVFLEDMSQ
jgi:hypothetical protein